MKLFELFEMTKDKETTITWMREKGLIAATIQCANCSDQMKISSKSSCTDGQTFICSKRNSRKTVSIRINSFFSRSKLPPGDLLIFIHLWAKEYPSKLIYTDFNFAKKTVIDWSRFRRDLCVEHFDSLHSVKIGGEGTIVEIDESVMVKRKYNRGRVLKTQWIFGGIQRTTDGTKKFFMELVEDRKEITLLEVIRRKIEVETRIISDGWRSYANLSNHGYIHDVVIHEENFLDPDNSEINTQRIENMWGVIKKFLCGHGSNKLPHEFEYLAELVLRWSSPDFFDEILNKIRLKYRF